MEVGIFFDFLCMCVKFICLYFLLFKDDCVVKFCIFFFFEIDFFSDGVLMGFGGFLEIFGDYLRKIGKMVKCKMLIKFIGVYD